MTLVLAFALLGGSAPAEPPDPAPGVERLGWLAGCWSNGGGEREVLECWTEPAGGAMLALHRELRPGKRAWFEYLRIVETDEGVVYLASPGGRSPTAFPLREASEGRVVFENLEHDFPQRIIYALNEAGDLEMRTEGEVDGQLRGSRWSLQPAPFPGPAR